MNEVWVDIIGFEGLYQVSNLGNVKSMSHVQCYVDSINRTCTRTRKGRVLIPALMRDNGYLGVTLYKNGVRCTRAVHRLVAEAFIPNTDGLPQVNHRDEDKTNNRIDNLEWCTTSYNVNYGTANDRRSIRLRKIRGGSNDEE